MTAHEKLLQEQVDLLVAECNQHRDTIQMLQARYTDALMHLHDAQHERDEMRALAAKAQLAAELIAERDELKAWKEAERDQLRQQLETERAAVPVPALRRIYAMHVAHQWSSVESPPLYEAFGAWLATLPEPAAKPSPVAAFAELQEKYHQYFDYETDEADEVQP